MASQLQDNFYLGDANVHDFQSEYNKLIFVVNQVLKDIQTTTLVKVVSVEAGGVGPVGNVNVTPLVEQIDANRNVYPQGVIHNLPYLRIQGGTNAIIIDPQVGDIGICVFANKDISNVISTKKSAAPASYRQFSFSDGLYLGGVLNNTPANFIHFDNNEITITSNTNVTINAPSGTTLNGNLQVNGNITATGTIHSDSDITSDTISLQNHLHSGVQSGGSNSGPPVP